MTPARQPQHCDHECVCPEYKASHSDWEEDPDPCTFSCMQRAIHTSAPAPDKPKFSSEDLLLLAHDEWKRREERKHLHNEQDWISGFINGFLTEPTWARKMVDKIRADAKHQSTKGGEHR